MTFEPLNSELVQSLADLLGPKGCITDEAEISPHLNDWRGNYSGQSALLLRPKTTTEVSEVVKLCAQFDQPITPQGGNTGLVNGGIAYGEVILSLQRLNTVRDIDVQNNSMTVEAGCILENILNTAEKAGRFFPLHLGSQGTATIGGLVSTNAGGCAVLRYGMMRDLILGLEVVTPAGDIWTSTSGLRKDNTGYDLKHLYCGAEGTLGVVTAATLKLFPIPRTATAWLAIQTVEKAVELLSNIRAQVGDCITGFEFMGQQSISLTVDHIPTSRDPLPGPAPWRVLLELSMPSEEDAEKSLESILEQNFEQNLIEDGVIANSMAQTQNFWAIREGIPEVKRSALTAMNFDVSVPISKVSSFLDECKQAIDVQLPNLEFIAFGHLGDGNIHYSIAEPKNCAIPQVRANSVLIETIVNETTTKLGGSISAEHGIGLLKRDTMPIYKPAVELEMMRSIKRALDPKNIMNPGRVISV